jgi:hypothetical protein
LGAIMLALCASVRLDAQQPAAPAVPSADTAKTGMSRSGADTVSAGLAPADSAPVDSATAYRRVTLAEYVGRVVGPRALLKDVALAGIGQALKRPTGWSNTWGGYGNRLSSRLGSAAVSQAVTLGAAAALDERPAEFTLCRCAGTRGRFVHAALIPWQMDSPKGTHLSLIAPVSEIGGAILVTSMSQRGFSVGDGVRAGAAGVLVSSLFSVAREFWPWHRRPPGF